MLKTKCYIPVTKKDVLSGQNFYILNSDEYIKPTEEEVYVLTEEELLKFIKYGWEFYKNNFLHYNIVPEDFIKSLNP